MPGRAGKVKGGKQKVEKKEKKEKSECSSSCIVVSMAPYESQCFVFRYSWTCLLDQTSTDSDACSRVQCPRLRSASFYVMSFSGLEQSCALWWLKPA
jgi:hypothetical protein